ncbi:hypothetical protein DBV39_05160 [Orrella marina]|uniref:Uncharacterized protein n=1 Tax=Orrella marina TaxID=2163011 RepID=A0A2R4XHJ8_9BURK|nr:hypothetical protein DBV39_05160 [Orrella marina]
MLSPAKKAPTDPKKKPDRTIPIVARSYPEGIKGIRIVPGQASTWLVLCSCQAWRWRSCLSVGIVESAFPCLLYYWLYELYEFYWLYCDCFSPLTDH